MILFISGCNGGPEVGGVGIDGAIESDNVPPVITFGAIASPMEGAQDHNVQYTITDNITGPQQAYMYYSPDGINQWTYLGAIPANGPQTPFCVPNINHPSPTFRIRATDGAFNTATEEYTVAPGINVNQPPAFNFTSDESSKTDTDQPKIYPSSCSLTACSASSPYFALPTGTSYIFLENGAGSPPNGTAGTASFGVNPNILNDSSNSFEKVQDGDTIRILSGTNAIVGDHVVAVSGVSSNSLTFTTPIISSGNPTDISYRVVRSSHWVDCETARVSGIDPDSFSGGGEGEKDLHIWFGVDTDGDGDIDDISSESAGINFEYRPSALTFTVQNYPVINTPNANISISECTNTAFSGASVDFGTSAVNINDYNLNAFTNVVPGDVINIISGTNAVSGSHTVLTAGTNGLSTTTSIVSAGGPVSDFIYTILKIDGAADFSVNPRILNDSTTNTFQNVVVGDIVKIESGINVTPGKYTVTAINSVNSLTLSADFITTGTSSDINYSIIKLEQGEVNAAVDTKTLNDASTNAFLNVPAGSTITLVSGTDAIAGSYTITSKSANSVLLDGNIVTSGSHTDYMYYVERPSRQISEVIFKTAAGVPLATDPDWQSCTTTPFALNSPTLTPDNWDLKAYLKYENGDISTTAIDVPITYVPEIVWEEAPAIKYTSQSFTTPSCSGVDEILINEDGVTVPGMGDAGWTACSTVSGSYTHTLAAPIQGNNPVYAWYKVPNGVQHVVTVPATIQVNYDTIPPDMDPTWQVFGTVITDRTPATFRLDSCSDVNMVNITDNVTAQPGEFDPNWVNCEDVNLNILYNDLTPGVNGLRFWGKDVAGNVSTDFIARDVTYIPPTLAIRDGPIIDYDPADISISHCVEPGISEVAIRVKPSVQPGSGDADWQTCSTTGYALDGPTLSPGQYTFEVWFKYSDSAISTIPLELPVTYTPKLSWFDSPVTYRLDTYVSGSNSGGARLTIPACTGISHVFVKTGATVPASGDPNWQPCSTTPGAIRNTEADLVAGSNNLNIFFKEDPGAGVYSSATDTVNLTYQQPTFTILGGTNNSHPTGEVRFTVDHCGSTTDNYQKITHVLVNESATYPPAGSWVACSTASNAISYQLNGGAPVTGAYPVYMWFKFDDGGTGQWESTDFDTETINYTNPDTTPPTGLTFTIDNGTGPQSVTGATAMMELPNGETRADLDLNTCTDINSVLVTYVSRSAAAPPLPLNSDPDWVTCNDTAGAIQTPTLPNPSTPNEDEYDIYVWYRDTAQNIQPTPAYSGTNINWVRVENTDLVPPDRPLVTVVGGPTLTTSPATFTVSSCNTSEPIDQVFFKPMGQAAPSATDSGWQNCTTAVGGHSYTVTTAGNYDISAWFKDAAGNVSTLPRDVSFIFDPQVSVLPGAIAYWTMDSQHQFHKKMYDSIGDNHGAMFDVDSFSYVSGKVSEALMFNGTDTYIIVPQTSLIKPTSAVSLSAWVYLTASDAGTKGLAGNAAAGQDGVGLYLDGGFLFFRAGSETRSVATSSYSTGWHNITGTFDGQISQLYIDGVSVDNGDTGTPALISYGCANTFVIGSRPTCTPNASTEYFDERIDDVVMWNVALTSQQAYDHYIDGENNYMVNQSSTAPADVTAGNLSFYKDELQVSLNTITNCLNTPFIYIDETTHPPLANDPDWQPCSTVIGGHQFKNPNAGYHELKFWTKDRFGNVSNSFARLDTTITGLSNFDPAVGHWNLDNTHVRVVGPAKYIDEIYSDNNATVSAGLATGVSAIQNEGFNFIRLNSDYVEAPYASNLQTKQNVTLSVWADFDPASPLDQVIAGNRIPGSGGYSLEIVNGANELQFLVETAGGTRSIGIPIPDEGFHNVIATYDGTTMKLFVDSLTKTPTSESPPFGGLDGVMGPDQDIKYDCLSSFIIGGAPDAACNNGVAGAKHYDGVIDEVVVFDNILDQTTINNLFDGQDSIPPSASANPASPQNNDFTIGIPVAKFYMNTCDPQLTDVVSVYIERNNVKPDSDAANWQACDTNSTLSTIEGPDLPGNGVYSHYVWVKDRAGNVSTSSQRLDITVNLDLTIPAANTLSYWPLDAIFVNGSQALDIVGLQHAVVTGATEATSGSVDESLAFDGVNDFLEASYDSSHQPANEVTIQSWIKPNAVWDANTYYIAGNHDGSGGYALVVGNNSIEFHVRANGVTNIASFDTSAGPLDHTVYTHVVGAYDGTQLRLFINGTEEVTVPMGGTFPIEYANNNSFIIGAQATTTTGAAGNYFPGEIDEVALFDVGLSDTVVTEMYNRGLNDDKIWYDVVPPNIPVALNILFYNALVSRANLTVTDCTGIDYIIVTNSTFPPDKNDENWQLCNTMEGGLLSAKLSSSEIYGKVWLKDVAGNISTTYEFVPVQITQDFSIKRPHVHWTFDSTHWNAGSRMFIDRMKQTTLFSDSAYDANPGGCPGPGCEDYQWRNQAYWQPNITPAVLKESTDDGGDARAFLRADDNSNLRPTNEVTIAAWIWVPTTGNIVSTRYIAGNANTEKSAGYGLRYDQTTQNFEFMIGVPSLARAPYAEKTLMTNNPNEWHLLVGTYDGQNAKIYVDGIFVKEFSAPVPTPITYDSNLFFVGEIPTANSTPAYHATGTSDGWNYQIDEVLIWDRALDGLEISSLYHNGADIIHDPPPALPAIPTVTMENQRPTNYADSVYGTVSSCSGFSGVLVNEGTRPDKQDARWEICRDTTTRRGAHGLTNLTNGGHTVTYWFKDLAGTVSSTSADLVFDYVQLTLPRGNAYWPLDRTMKVDNHTYDVISETFEHDLELENFENNPSVSFNSTIAKVGDNADFSGTRGYITGGVTNMIQPVNFVSIAGWFYVSGSETSDFLAGTTDDATSGYFLAIDGSGFPYFRTYLDIEPSSTVTATTDVATLGAGWHHIAGTFDGLNMRIYVNAVLENTVTLPELDYIDYDVNYRFNIGAMPAASSALPTQFFNGRADEVAVWGLTLSAANITSLKALGDAGNPIEDLAPDPNNVLNAYVTHYDTMDNRARMTVSDCTNTKFVLVKDDVGGAPSADDPDWHKCNTYPGGIWSKELSVEATPKYVEVWSKNFYGDVSTVPAIREVDPVSSSDNDTLAQPIMWLSMNDEHMNGVPNRTYDFMSDLTGIAVGGNITTDALSGIEGIDFVDGANRALYVPYSPMQQPTHTMTLSGWVDIDNTETGLQYLFGNARNGTSAADGYSVYLENGSLKFHVSTATATSGYTNSIPLTDITSGLHQITVKFDGQYSYIFIDGVLRSTTDYYHQTSATGVPVAGRGDWGNNPPARTVNRLHYSQQSDFSVGYDRSAGTYYFDGSIGDVQFWPRDLSEEEIVAWYEAFQHVINPGDNLPPSLSASNIAVFQGTGSGPYGTDNPNPLYTITDCTDIAGVYITLDGAATPLHDDQGWFDCQTDVGHLISPTLSDGVLHTVHFWIKDKNGNVNPASASIQVQYDQPTPGSYPIPTLYFTFDSDTKWGHKVYDQSPSALTGYLWEAVLSTNSARVSEGVEFNGIDHYFNVPHNTAFKPTDELTVSAWVEINHPDSPTDDDVYFSVTSNGRNEGYKMWQDSQSCGSFCTEPRDLVFEITIDGQRRSIRMLNDWITDGLRHMVWTWDGRFLRWYVDTVLMREQDYLSVGQITYDAGNTTPLTIGADSNDDKKALGNYLGRSSAHKTVDEFAIWDTALYPHQITEVYNQGFGGNHIYDPGLTVANPVGGNYSVHELFGDRARVTATTCTNTDLILIQDAVNPAPAANDVEWQECNTMTGGLLSKALGHNAAVTLQVWAKDFTGDISAASANIAGTVDTTDFISTIDMPRPDVHLAFDNSGSGYVSGSYVYDTMSMVYASMSATNPVQPSTNPIIDEGFDFGSNMYIAFPPQPSSNDDDQITVSAWVYLVQGDGNNRHIAGNLHSESNDDDSEGIALRTRNGFLEFAVNSNTPTSARPESAKVSTFSYETGMHHVIGTYDNDRIRLYLDGNLVATHQFFLWGSSSPGDILSDDYSHWMIGAETGTNNAPVAATYHVANTTIDDLMIFRKALNDSEAWALYLYGSLHIPANTADVTPPTDPGISIVGGTTAVSTPFPTFTMPDCSDVNAVMVSFTDISGTIEEDDSGWQFCSEEEGFIKTSSNIGYTQTIYIYFKDEAGNVQTGHTVFNLTYNPPNLPNPFHYHSFDAGRWSSDHLNSNAIIEDTANTTDIWEWQEGTRHHRDSTGKVGEGFRTCAGSFCGNANNAVTLYTEASQVNGTDITLAIWYHDENTDSSDGDLFVKDGNYRIRRKQGGKVEVTIWTTGFNITRTSESIILPNQWNHIAVKREGGVLKIFLNGELDSSFIVNSNTLRNNYNQLAFGGLDGSYDEFLVYDQALTDDQVQNLFFKGENNETITVAEPNVVPAPIPEEYLSFDTADFAGGTLTNQAPNGTFNLTEMDMAITSGAAGQVAESFEFERYTGGARDYLDATANIDLLGNDFTFSWWQNVNLNVSNANADDLDEDSEYHTVFGQWGGPNADQNFRFMIHRNGYFQFQVRLANDSLRTLNWNSLGATLNQWYHITVTRRSNLLTMYVNGFEVVRDNGLGTQPIYAASPNPLRFGASFDLLATADFDGEIDEWSYWNEALPQNRIKTLYNRGVGAQRVPLAPEAMVDGSGGQVTSQDFPDFYLNDCNGHTHILIDNSASPQPLDGNPNWIACSAFPTVISGAGVPYTLTADALNNLNIWFKTGSTVNTTPTAWNVTHTTPDTTPPTNPVVNLVTGTPTTSAFATYTVTSCNAGDIDQVFVGKTSSPPNSSTLGWVPCTTGAGEIKAPPLDVGDNNYSVWVMDAAGNVQNSPAAWTGTIVYNQPTIPDPSFYLSLDDQVTNATWTSDVVNDGLFNIVNPLNTTQDQQGQVQEAVYFTGNARLVADDSFAPSISHPTNNLTYASWVNLSTPTSHATLIARWNGSQAQNQYRIIVQTDGKLCMDIQTTASGGSWGENAYKRVCSLGTVTFGLNTHVAVKRVAGTVTFYLNGKVSGTSSVDSSNLHATTTVIEISSTSTGGTFGVDGNMEEIGLWTSGLTNDQVEALYAKGTNGDHSITFSGGDAPPIPFIKYDFDSGTPDVDKMGNNNLNAGGGPTLYTPVQPIVGEAYQFVSAENDSKTASNNSLNLGTQFAIQAWVNVTTTFGVFSNGIIAAKWGGSAATDEFLLRKDGTRFKFSYHTNGNDTWGSTGYNEMVAANTHPHGEWYHVVVTRNGSILRMYINGELEAEHDAGTDPLEDLAQGLTFGADPTALTFLDGDLDEIVFWKRSLTERQVRWLYNQGNPNASINAEVPITNAASLHRYANDVKSVTNNAITIGDCSNYPGGGVWVALEGDATPPGVHANWQACDETPGAINLTPAAIINGNNNLDIYFKTSGDVVNPTPYNLDDIDYAP